MTELAPLPYGRQSIDDDDVAAVVAALKGDFLTQGAGVAKFEEALCRATNAKYAVAVSSGTAALHLAYLAAGMRPGDVGLTSDVTFVASANGMRYAGAEPVLVDVEPDTGLIALDALERRFEALGEAGRRPKVITPVDLTGAVADLPSIHAFAKKSGAVVVEDAAHSLGAEYTHGGQVYRAASCVHADMACLSFHPVKHVTTAEGGAIMTSDQGLYEELLDLRTHGITKDPARLEANDGPWYYEQRILGFNYRIPDLNCALGTSQMAKLERFVARRRAIAKRYDTLFEGESARVTPLRIRDGVKSSYHLYVIRLVPRQGESLASVAERRKALYLALREVKIFTQVHYIPVHRQPDFVRAGLAGGEFPGSDTYYAGCLSIPMFPSMTDADVERVAAAVLANA